MIIDLDETRLRTLDQMRAVPDGTQTLDGTPTGDARDRAAWMDAVLIRLGYWQLKRSGRGVVLRYLRRFSGFSRAQVTRHVRRWVARSSRFPRVAERPATRLHNAIPMLTSVRWPRSSARSAGCPGRRWW